MTSPSPKPRCVILGSGGHARVVIDCLRASGAAESVAAVDADSTRWGSAVDDVPVRGGDDQLAILREEGVTLFAVGIGQGPRAKLFAVGRAAVMLQSESGESQKKEREGRESGSKESEVTRKELRRS